MTGMILRVGLCCLSLFLLGNNLAEARILALVDTILNKDVTVLEAQGDVGRKAISREQCRVAALLHKQLEHLLAVTDQVLVVLQDDLERLLEDTVLGHHLHTANALQLKSGTLKAVLLRAAGGEGVEFLDRHSSRVKDLVVFCRQDHSDMGLATGDQRAIANSLGRVGQIKDGLDVLEVDVKADPVGEQCGSLEIVKGGGLL